MCTYGTVRCIPTWAVDDEEPGISLCRYRHARLRWLAIGMAFCAFFFYLGTLAHV